MAILPVVVAVFFEMITATEINLEEMYCKGENRDHADLSIYDKLKPFRIFRIRDHSNEPVPIYGDESWMNSTEYFPKKYATEKTLYESEYVKVELCKNIQTTEQVAIKFIRLLKESIDSKIKTRHDRIEREISIIQTLRHNYIIGFKEVIRMVDCVCIVMEYAKNGELFEYVRRNLTIHELEAKKIMFQIFLAVDNLHSKGIVHRDLKLENILLDERYDVKIADFGFANYYYWNKTTRIDPEMELVLTTSCGSPCYAAPEIVLNNKGYSGFKADIWSCGVIMFALLFGHLPFEDQAIRQLKLKKFYLGRSTDSSLNVYQLYQYISKNQLDIPKRAPISGEAADLIKGMLRSDPAKRITLTDVFRHNWFANSQLL